MHVSRPPVLTGKGQDREVRTPQSKIMSLSEAVAWRNGLRAAGDDVAVTNGCFDLLHRGHVEYLSRARELGAKLLIALNSDASVSRIKGPTRPVVKEDDRAYMLASLEAVDAVLIFDTPTALDVLKILEPDLYVKGGDYTVETLVQEEYTFLTSVGCRVELLPLVAGFSTTDVIKQVKGN